MSFPKTLEWKQKSSFLRQEASLGIIFLYCRAPRKTWEDIHRYNIIYNFHLRWKLCVSVDDSGMGRDNTLICSKISPLFSVIFSGIKLWRWEFVFNSKSYKLQYKHQNRKASVSLQMRVQERCFKKSLFGRHVTLVLMLTLLPAPPSLGWS